MQDRPSSGPHDKMDAMPAAENRRMSLSQQRILLAVVAHPDDESFAIGGTLARYAAQGAQVHVIVATDGSAGTVTPEALDGHASIAELRMEELRCAAEQLGLTGTHLLGYRDSGMPGSPENEHPDALAAAPLEAVAAKVARYIRELKPQVVITHDPIGNYHHPDHIAIHQATVQAFEMAGKDSAGLGPSSYRPQKLYFNTFNLHRLNWFIRLLSLFGRDPRAWGRNRDIDLLELTKVGFPIHARIDVEDFLDIKRRAASCHASQQDGGPPSRGLLGWLLQRMGRRETYMRAYPQAAPSLREADLFSGVSLDPGPKDQTRIEQAAPSPRNAG